VGQASSTATERYDHQTVANLQIAAAKLEPGQTFAPPPLPRARLVSAAECGERENRQSRLREFVVIEVVWKWHVASEDQSCASGAPLEHRTTVSVAVHS
jgi:hypothetical protein